MTAPVDRLYDLTERDAVSALWGPYTRNFDDATVVPATGLVTSPGLDWLRSDTVFWARHVVAELDTTGIASAPIDFRLYLADQVGAARQLLFGFTVPNANQVNGTRWTEQAPIDFPFLGGTHRIYAVSNFSGALVGNLLELSLHGVLTPRGNVVLQ